MTYSKSIRFNNLKIYINAGEAKPGGLIGAMLSPYLYSTSMTTFCKGFNDQTKEYDNKVFMAVKVRCDSANKSYTFVIKPLPISLFLLYAWTNEMTRRGFTITFLYDLTLYYREIYKVDLYHAAIMIYLTLKSFKRKVKIITFFNELMVKFKTQLQPTN